MVINTSARPLKVAIVGGGPGDLATAIALDMVPNVEVVLYEKSQVLREVGAGISIGQNFWNVLELLVLQGVWRAGILQHKTKALSLAQRPGRSVRGRITGLD
jgi:2-polyprenyl-6-methoxyphenol hydroxylase-like FAD-dependent oxidoreductase